MPTVLAYIADYIAFYFAAVGNYVVSYWAAYAIVYAAEVYAISRAVQSLQPGAPKGEGRSLEVAITDTGQPGYAIYGEVRVGGVNIVPPITGGNNGEFLEQVLAFAVHEVDSYRDFYVDDGAFSNSDLAAVTGSSTDGQLNTSKYKDNMWVRRYTGTSTQTVDYILTNRYPGVFTSDFRGRGIAYAAITYNWGDGKTYRGIPIMSFVIRGKKCYDPRLDSSPGANPTNPSYIAWTSNPALCWADYAMADYGGALTTADIDWASVISAANSCDGTVSIPGGGSQKRYTFNCRIVLPTDPDWRQNAKLMIDAMIGRMVRRDGKWFIYAGATRSADYSIAKIDWLAIDSIKTVASRDGGRWNAVSCWYVDASRNWQRVECYRRKNTTYKSADGAEDIPLEIEQPGCNNEYEAQRKAELILRQSRNQIALSGRLGPKYRKIATGDILALDFQEFGWASKLFRVRSMNLNPDSSVGVGLVEEQAADWDDLAAADYNTISTTSPPATNPTTPSEATLSIGNSIAGTIRFNIATPVVHPIGTRFRLIRGLTSNNAAVGTIIYDGISQMIDLPTANVPYYYWSQAYVDSYSGPYSPNTVGLLGASFTTNVTQVNCTVSQVYSSTTGLGGGIMGRADFAPTSADAIISVTATVRAGAGNVSFFNRIALGFNTGVTSSYLSSVKQDVGGNFSDMRNHALTGVFTYTANNSAYAYLTWEVGSGPNSMQFDNLSIRTEYVRL